MMDTLNNQENIETYNKGTESTKVAEDKEFYERYYQAKLEHEVIKVFYTQCIDKYKIIFPLGIMSFILIVLSLLSVIPSYFIIFAIIIICVCGFFDEYADKKPINDEYLNKVHQQIQHKLLFKNDIHLNESLDSFNQKINTIIKNFLKKEEYLRYKDIINLYYKCEYEFQQIEKEFKNKNNMNKQSELIDKYFG